MAREKKELLKIYLLTTKKKEKKKNKINQGKKLLNALFSYSATRSSQIPSQTARSNYTAASWKKF